MTAISLEAQMKVALQSKEEVPLICCKDIKDKDILCGNYNPIHKERKK